MWGDRAEVEGRPEGPEVTQGPEQAALSWRQARDRTGVGVTAGAGAGGRRELTPSWQHLRTREERRERGALSQGMAFG